MVSRYRLQEGEYVEILNSDAPQPQTIEESRGLAQHSNASADWGTPHLLRQFAACVLRPAAMSEEIDLDYASSAYWQSHWPDGEFRPFSYLDGSPGRDVLVEADRRAALTGANCGAGFLNAPGLNGGQMLQDCWEVFEADHRSGWLGSGVWIGFSLEQIVSLQGVGERHPLSINDGITTLVPSRRARYLLHPEAMIALIEKRRTRRTAGSTEWNAMGRKIEALRNRIDDSPVAGDAPPHGSYLSILWNRDSAVRRQQMSVAHQFLKTQSEQPKSLLQKVAIVGEMTP
jgi:hypothetical protein